MPSIYIIVTLLFLHHTTATPIVTNYETGRLLACNCLTSNNNQTNSSSTTLANFLVRNTSDSFLLTCNNTNGFTKYNASASFYNAFITNVLKVSNTTTTIGPINITKIISTTIFSFLEKTPLEKSQGILNSTYSDFFDCYKRNITNTNKKDIRFQPEVQLVHILLTLIVLILGSIIYKCGSMTRKRFYNRSLNGLPRLKHVFTPVLLQKKTKHYLQVVNEAKRPNKLGNAIVNQNKMKFQHLGCGFKHTQTYRSMIEFSFHQIEGYVANVNRGTANSIVLRRNEQSARIFLLKVVPNELNLDSQQKKQYVDRIQTYIRLYERARYGGDSLNEVDFMVAMGEVQYVQSMCLSMQEREWK